ncbi:hypothetical protein BZG36_04571 [Bifiguratus adelaidae]|uniref:chitin deacetylase n=1 Tax=Bifiguratus adelaidae TaxID=1938954 RepID=A0A261XUQ8_9FUNG|nr:hypothetical protein BZG36_04571 [Bifiguratus adelaidae]
MVMPGALGDYISAAGSNFPTTAPNSSAIPSIVQTTSYDATAECQSYSTNFAFTSPAFPTVWQSALTGTNSSSEFQAVYNSINWTAVPNIPPKTLSGSSYNTALDPDCWWTATGCTKPKWPGLQPDITACPQPETWGLTYDDGPNCSHNFFYDYLQEQNLKASMFYIGSNVADWPYGAIRGLANGHHIASHTWSHRYMTTLTNPDVVAEFYYTQKVLKMVTGVTPRYWRPPFGDVDDRIRAIAQQMNLQTIVWNLDTNDYEAPGTVSVAQVQNNYNAFITMGMNGTFAKSGNIVLSHELTNTTMQLAVANIPQIKAAYKQILNVQECMGITQPYVENFGTISAVNTTANASAVPSAAGTTTTVVVVAASATAAAASSSAQGNVINTGDSAVTQTNAFVTVAALALATTLLLI